MRIQLRYRGSGWPHPYIGRSPAVGGDVATVFVCAMVIAGAGPGGLMLAAELRLHGMGAEPGPLPRPLELPEGNVGLTPNRGSTLQEYGRSASL